MMSLMSFSLYIHIPFCMSKCAYCDFASWSGQEKLWADYVCRLKDEISVWQKSGHIGGRSIATLFIGGGTPSILPGEMIAEIMAAARELAPFEENAEITIEANPGTLTAEKLAHWKNAGINRISFGAQSFDDGLLRTLGRIHTADEIRQAVSMAREAGFKNINLDLMYALPGQTPSMWQDTLAAAIALGVPHISAYSLIVEEGTPMARRVESGAVSLPDEDAVNAMQRCAVDIFKSAGLHRYEISNYARKGFESRHNLTYWRRGDYLGLGCAAHSMLNGFRFANPAALDEYMSAARVHAEGGLSAFLHTNHYQDITPLGRQDAMEETLMLATRTAEGLDLAAWQRDFGCDFVSENTRTLRQLADAGLIRMEGNRLSLTTRGMEVQNAVVLALMD
ncbi:MAG: radical SAM family heme chaperone HemW [Clostridiales bacterium]|nr:radical SAM family heme chaperone HemW [Clostridiales bacterium]